MIVKKAPKSYDFGAFLIISYRITSIYFTLIKSKS